MRTAERTPKQTYSQEVKTEKESAPRSDSLRNELLGASKLTGAWAMIPRDTVTVELNSHTLKEGVFPGIGMMVDQIQKEPPYAKITDRGFGRLQLGKYMGSMRRDVLRSQERGESDANMTVLYEKRAEGSEDEELIPSAIMVHEKLTDEQIAELRAKLPEGVPLLDSRTNELLDDIGSKQREKERRDWNLKLNLADSALRDTVRPPFTVKLGASAYSNFNTYYADSRRSSQIMDEALRNFQGGDGASYTDYFGTGSNRNTSGKAKSRDYSQSFRATPESDEVREHRERAAKAEGMLNEKAAAFGADSWRDLSPSDQDRVRRQVLRDVHPDLNDGNRKLFQEVEFMTEGIKRESKTETGPSAPTPPENEASTAEGETPAPSADVSPTSDTPAIPKALPPASNDS